MTTSETPTEADLAYAAAREWKQRATAAEQRVSALEGLLSRCLPIFEEVTDGTLEERILIEEVRGEIRSAIAEGE